MKGFKLDENGDIVIENGDIVLISGDDLKRQTIETVIGTNKGEWFLNENEGINFKNILTKSPETDAIKDEITSGLMQADESFLLDSFQCTIDETTRKARIEFTATDNNGRAIKSTNTF